MPFRMEVPAQMLSSQEDKLKRREASGRFRDEIATDLMRLPHICYLGSYSGYLSGQCCSILYETYIQMKRSISNREALAYDIDQEKSKLSGRIEPR